MHLILSLLLLSSLTLADTSLLLIGGGKRPVEAMRQFSVLAGSNKSDILIIPWASESTEGAEVIRTELSTHTNGKIEIVPHRLNPKDLGLLITHIEKCSGIFFTGGNQNILMNLIKEYQLGALLKKRYFQGAVFGGTSAGTAIMSNPMLTGGGDLSIINGSQTELAEGLGLLPQSVIVDQHFIVRSRFNRLAGLILESKGDLGIGIDENTALLIKGNEARVIGPTQVLIFKKESDSKLGVSVMSPGSSFSL
jgi:cyanophycinase